jgi:hypothetical protein
VCHPYYGEYELDYVLSDFDEDDEGTITQCYYEIWFYPRSLACRESARTLKEVANEISFANIFYKYKDKVWFYYRDKLNEKSIKIDGKRIKHVSETETIAFVTFFSVLADFPVYDEQLYSQICEDEYNDVFTDEYYACFLLELCRKFNCDDELATLIEERASFSAIITFYESLVEERYFDNDGEFVVNFIGAVEKCTLDDLVSFIKRINQDHFNVIK